MPEAFWTRDITRPCTGLLHFIDYPPRQAVIDWGYPGAPLTQVYFTEDHTRVEHTYPATAQAQQYTITMSYLDSPPGQETFPAMGCGVAPAKPKWKPLLGGKVGYWWPQVGAKVMIDQWDVNRQPPYPHNHVEIGAVDGEVKHVAQFCKRRLYTTSYIIDREWHGQMTVEPGIDLSTVPDDGSPCCLSGFKMPQGSGGGLYQWGDGESSSSHSSTGAGAACPCNAPSVQPKYTVGKCC